MSRASLASRTLLWVTALALVAIALLHGMGVSSLGAELDAAQLKPFVAGGFRAVWLGFSVTAVLLALVFAGAALRPQFAGRAALTLLALVPIASALLVYHYIGPFAGAHMMMAAGLIGIAGAALRG
jgi:hypothetical protein